MSRLSGRSRIVQAALACAAEQGWEATSMGAVRTRAGVSNGSLFHHFPSRDALTTAVIAEGMANHQETLLRVLRGADDARAGVQGVVVAHLGWIAENPSLARLLLSAPAGAPPRGLEAAVADENRAIFGEVAAWLTAHGWTRRPDLPVVLALWTGPAQAYARRWLADQVDHPSTVADDLACGAWRALAPLLEGRCEP